MESATVHKDLWDKARVVLEPMGGLLTALAVASLGFFGSRHLDKQQRADAKLRLYSELMSKREDSESGLRKDMLQTIMTSFLDPRAGGSLETEVLKMELLAQNFHEALNLEPLFKHLRREIRTAPVSVDDRRDYQLRVSELAREVARKQILILEGAGARFNRFVDFDSLKGGEGPIQLEDAELTLDGVKRRFRVTVLAVDFENQELKLRLEIATPTSREESATGEIRTDAEFPVGYFSFPMIDNTRLSHDQRCSIVLTNFGKSGAEIAGLFFPGSRASLREKPYYEEVLQTLKDSTE